MKSFLSQVIANVLQKNKAPLVDTIFVLPSQRACVFLKNELVKQLNNASFLPRLISIEKYIQELSEVKQLDNVQLLFEFYSIYQKHTEKDKQDPFDVFSQWATIVLQDFNEMDRHLIDAKDLFIYLRDINRLKNWSPTTTITKNYFSFFENLYTYYNEFYKHLLTKKKGYQGLIYREAESNIQHYISSHTNKHIVLVGFNALNTAEERIFQELLESGLASIYWDADESYMSNSKETGFFLRKYKKEWNYFDNSNFNWITNHLNTQEKQIKYINATNNTGQIKYVGELIGNIKNHNNIALVLADESLLSLTLNSLPNNVEKINITMGFPLNDIPVSIFFTTIFNLYLNQQKMGVSDANKYYFKDLLQLFNQPYFKKIFEEDSLNLSANLGKSNLIFLNINQIESLFRTSNQDDFLKVKFLFTDQSNQVETIISNCISICKLLKDKVDGIEKEYVYRFFTVFQQLQLLNNEYNHIDTAKTLYQFFLQMIQNEKLSFQGEPLEGLQLMGMLETRVIDFETVILTSVNEGILPASKSERSFIPFDVKKHFNLPTYQEKDAIFSYHFFRLLHRAKNIYLVYNSEGDAYGTGEKSRFMSQLELMRNDIEQQILVPDVSMKPNDLQEIFKTDELLEQLKKLGKKGISPSAIATYIYNPIDFYYQKILKIREVEEVEETVAVNTMGTVIHETLEVLYKPYMNQFLTVDALKKMKKDAEDLVVQNFQKVYKNGDISQGKNKLIFEVSKKYIDRFLNQELALLKSGSQLKIIGLERKLASEIEIPNLEFPVKIHGIIDRIDELDGVTRIIDYKTGMVKENQLKMPDFSIIPDDYKHTKALQVMLYTYLYAQETNFDFSTQTMEAGIISFKNLNNGFLKMNFAENRSKNNQINQEILDNFIVEVQKILEEIYNKEIPFEENPNKAF